MRGAKVLLVEKNRPEWQAGLLNAIGGEIEPGENPHDAMVREFEEETGRRVSGWQFFASETGPDYMVHFYRQRIAPEDDWRSPYKNDVGEYMAWYTIEVGGLVTSMSVPAVRPMIGNLGWLLPLCLDPRDIYVTARTTSNIKEIKTW
jgi:hypothetical protein